MMMTERYIRALTRQEIAARLRWHRVACGLTQREVAEHMDLHRVAITQLEGGKRRIRAEELYKLAAFYCTPVSTILDPDAKLYDPCLLPY